MSKENTDEIGYMKSMMQSIFAYGVLLSTNSYLAKYKRILGEDTFNEVFNEYSKYLEETFTVSKNVYTDHEGCTYNSLVKK